MNERTKLPQPKQVEAPPIQILYQDGDCDESDMDWNWMLGLLAGIILGLLIAKLF
nr:hypothetical protein [uncultured Acinetobacter sp.]